MRLPVVLLLCTFFFLPTSAWAASETVQSATYDLFMPLTPDTMDPDTSCDAHALPYPVEPGTIKPLEDGFHFDEGVTQFGGIVLEDATTRVGCAMARWHLDVPPGSDHLHIRFDADRSLQQTVTLDPHMAQQVLVLSGDTLLFRGDVFAPTEGSRDRTRINQLGVSGSDLVPIPEDTTEVTLVWYFHDLGQEQQGTTTLLSGQTYKATVWAPWVEFSGHPLEIQGIARHTTLEGTSRIQYTEVRAYVPQDILDLAVPNLRLRVDPELRFDHLTTPDGTRITERGSYISGEEYSPHLGRIILEPRNSLLQVTIPGNMVTTHGNGTYTFTFQQVAPLDTNPALWALNAVLLSVPLVFGLVTFQRVDAFRRQAFGGYRRSARNLLVATVLVFAYYVAVLVTSSLVGWIEQMAAWPAGWEAALMYLQITMAGAAFVWLWLTGKELYAITKP